MHFGMLVVWKPWINSINRHFINSNLMSCYGEIVWWAREDKIFNNSWWVNKSLFVCCAHPHPPTHRMSTGSGFCWAENWARGSTNSSFATDTRWRSEQTKPQKLVFDERLDQLLCVISAEIIFIENSYQFVVAVVFFILNIINNKLIGLPSKAELNR